MSIRPRLASSLQIASRGIGWSPPAKENMWKLWLWETPRTEQWEWRHYRAVENHWNSRMAQTQMQQKGCTHKATSTKHQSATHCFNTSWTSSYPKSIRTIDYNDWCVSVCVCLLCFLLDDGAFLSDDGKLTHSIGSSMTHAIISRHLNMLEWRFELKDCRYSVPQLDRPCTVLLFEMALYLSLHCTVTQDVMFHEHKVATCCGCVARAQGRLPGKIGTIKSSNQLLYYTEFTLLGNMLCFKSSSIL